MLPPMFFIYLNIRETTAICDRCVKAKIIISINVHKFQYYY